MLKIKLPKQEYYDEDNEVFIEEEPVELLFEHSLLALSKWESLFEKRFLDKAPKEPEENEAYYECMYVSEAEFSTVKHRLMPAHHQLINEHINAKHTATMFSEIKEQTGMQEPITSELIYYWMITFNIPFECDRWHLNKLFALIRVCSNKQQKPKKMSRGEMARRNAELNAKRKAELNTSG